MRNGKQAKNLRPLGENEILVLCSARNLGRASDTGTIMRHIRRRTRRDMTHTTVFTTLRRLEARGLLAGSLGDPVAKRGGKRRALFQLTEAGESLLIGTRQRLEAIWA